MAPALGDLAVFEDRNFIGIANGGQPVRDHERGDAKPAQINRGVPTSWDDFAECSGRNLRTREETVSSAMAEGLDSAASAMQKAATPGAGGFGSGS